MTQSRREKCVECRGEGLVCGECGLAMWDEHCDECGAPTVDCPSCEGVGGFDMPTPAAARDAKYFGSPEETKRLRDEAVVAAESGETVAAPILGFVPSEAEPVEAKPLRWESASRDVLFVPHADGRERVLLTEPGADEGDELDLPSKQIYRGRAALSPNGKSLAVASPVCCRRVETETGESREILQGPWQVSVAWLDHDTIAVLTKAGDWELVFADPDVAEMPSVKSFPKGTQKSATMRAPGMLHVVDTRHGSDITVSVRVNADVIETLQGGRLVVLRREPPKPDAWGTLFMRHDEGKLTSLAKLNIDIGEVSEQEGGIRGACGFDVLGLDVEGPQSANHRTITETLVVEEPPPPPEPRIGVPQSELRFDFVDAARPERTDAVRDRFDWLGKHATSGMALGAHDEKEVQRFFLFDLQRDTEVAIEPPLLHKTIEYAWAADGSRLIAWKDRSVWEIARDGTRRELVEAAGPVTSAAPLVGSRVAVLYRFKETDGELDVYDVDGKLEACVPLHPFDRVWSLHGGKLVIVGHKNPDTDLAHVHVLAVRPSKLSVSVGSGREGCLRFVAKQIRFATAMKMPVKQVWDVDGVGHLELATGGVYRVDGDVDAMAKQFEAVPRLDHRTGSDLFLDQGYIDEEGKWLTDPIWKGVDDWQAGRGRVHFSGQGQIALVDESGVVLTPPCFSEIHEIREGIAAVSVGGVRGKGAKCGAIDRDGGWVIAPEHDFVGDLEEGHMRVRDGERWALHDATGRVMGSDFALAGNFSQGLAIATRDGKTGGFLRPDGSWAFEGDMVDAYPFTEVGLSACKLASGKWAFVDTKGRLLDGRWDVAYPHKPVLDAWRAPVRAGDTWGWVDERGELIGEPRFFRTYSHSPDGIAPVQITSARWSYADVDGELLHEQGWERTFNVIEGVGWFKQGGKLGAIDLSGAVILQPDIDAIRNFNGGFAPIKRGDLWGIVSSRGDLAVELRFEDALEARDLTIGVKESGSWGFIGLDWEWAISPQFRSVGRFQEGRARAQAPKS